MSGSPLATQDLTTPLIADAAVRLKIELRTAPPGIRPADVSPLVDGRALPVRHHGSVDVFLAALATPLFSYGTASFGPTRAEPWTASSLESAVVGDARVTRGDHVFADRDGVLFAPAGDVDRLIACAREIDRTERLQMERIGSGTSLREQLEFASYLRRRRQDPSYGFRDHLAAIGAAVET